MSILTRDQAIKKYGEKLVEDLDGLTLDIDHADNGRTNSICFAASIDIDGDGLDYLTAFCYQSRDAIRHQEDLGDLDWSNIKYTDDRSDI
jgi:hypothetical protein